jgi:hypothetical protein
MPWYVQETDPLLGLRDTSVQVKGFVFIVVLISQPKRLESIVTL